MASKRTPSDRPTAHVPAALQASTAVTNFTPGSAAAAVRMEVHWPLVTGADTRRRPLGTVSQSRMLQATSSAKVAADCLRAEPGSPLARTVAAPAFTGRVVRHHLSST